MAIDVRLRYLAQQTNFEYRKKEGGVYISAGFQRVHVYA